MSKHLKNFFLVATLTGFGAMACSSGTSNTTGTGGSSSGGKGGGTGGAAGGGAGGQATGGAAGGAATGGAAGGGAAGGAAAMCPGVGGAPALNLAILNAATSGGITPTRTAPTFTPANCP